MYQINQQLLFRSEKCACTGGGFTELMGTLVGIVQAPNGPWYQINTQEGVKTVQQDKIVRIL